MARVPAQPPPVRLRTTPAPTWASARLRVVHRRALAAATAAAVTAAACGSIAEPEGYRPATSIAVSAGVPAGNKPAPGVNGDGPLGLTAPAGPTAQDAGGAGFVPHPSAGYVPEVLVATSAGVLVGTPAGVAPVAGPAGRWPAVRVVDDLLGGLVVQRPGSGGANTANGTSPASGTNPTNGMSPTNGTSPTNGMSPTNTTKGTSPANPTSGQGATGGTTAADRPGDIVWLADQATAPVVVASDGSRLLDVGYGEGSPYVVVLRTTGSIDRIRLADRTATPMEHLDTDQNLLTLSAGGARHAATIGDNRCGSLQLRSATGQALTLPGPPPAECRFPRRPAYRLAALSPDSRYLAYTSVAYRADGLEVTTELAVVDLDSDTSAGAGIDRGRRVIAQSGERVTSLAFDGTRAVYLRRSATTAVVAIVVPATTQPEVQLSVPQPQAVTSVSFARYRLG